MRFLYIDCISGISGDMFLGACLDGLVPRDYFQKEIAKLPLKNFRIRIERVLRHHISATKFDVLLEKAEKTHRKLGTILDIIEHSPFSRNVKNNASAIFTLLAETEARVHATTPGRIHFHEVGGIDSIVDIVGACICLDYLQPDAVYSSPAPVPHGVLSSAHGPMPLPAPATLDLLRNYPLLKVDVQDELVTPTGAAILRNFSRGTLPPGQVVQVAQTGYGAGSQILPRMPNVVRLWSGTLETPAELDSALQIETNIDDMNPEVYPYLMEKLFQTGVMDVAIYPNVMKKGRPGVMISVLSDPALLPRIKEILFSETTTLGLRYFTVHREKLPRERFELDSPLGKVWVKKIWHQNRTKLVPEFESCKTLAIAKGMPLLLVYQQLIQFFNADSED